MNPYHKANYTLVPYGITSRALAQRMGPGRGRSAASNIMSGWNRWNDDIEAALYVLSDGNVELIQEVKGLAGEAYELRHREAASDV